MASVMNTVRNTVGRVTLAACTGALLVCSAPAFAAPANSDLAVRSEIARKSDDLSAFYRARGDRPLWIAPDGRVSGAVDSLLARLESAQFDGLTPRTVRSLDTRDVRRALDRAQRGDPKWVARADVAVSELFASYVRAMRGASHSDMIYEGPALAPMVPTAVSVLDAAAQAPSLDAYVREMGWMHPLYAPLRDAMNTRRYDETRRATIWENLDRIRALPATPADRYVLVDAASARLWMYEDGKPVDSMKVVVGKSESQTPAMAGFLRYAIVNPYWNVPTDLVQTGTANHVLKNGIGYLRKNGYEVLSGFDEGATVIDPKTIDWRAVANGTDPAPRVRQKPGGSNFMGAVKFEFPNAQGIYLHDTPERALLKADDRQFSNGCVRLEDAERFGKWLMGTSIAKRGKAPEQRIDLPTLVPVYITYLTALPGEKGIVFRDDVYGRDKSRTMMAYGG